MEVSKGGSVEAACQPVCHLGQGTRALIEALPSALSFSSLWGSLTCVIGVMMKALISPAALQYGCALCLSSPRLPCHLPRKGANKCIMTTPPCDRQARNLLATSSLVCRRNPDAYWHRNTLWSPFSSSLKGGFGLQAAVCSLVIVPPQPWAGFAPHPAEGLPC